MLIDDYLLYPTTEEANFESMFPKNGSNELHRIWAAEISAARKNFFLVAKQSRGGLVPVKETYKPGYKNFQNYLAQAIDIVMKAKAG
jgi:hypothetical protein